MRTCAIELTLVGLFLVSTAAMGQTRTASPAFGGRWSLTVNTSEGAETRTLDLAIGSDSSVTGTVTSSLGTLAIASGRVDGDRVRFTFAMAGGEVRVAYDLVLRADTLRGVFRQDEYTGEVLGVRGDRQVRFPTRPDGTRRLLPNDYKHTFVEGPGSLLRNTVHHYRQAAPRDQSTSSASKGRDPSLRSG